jgi:hypothetical protein
MASHARAVIDLARQVFLDGPADAAVEEFSLLRYFSISPGHAVVQRPCFAMNELTVVKDSLAGCTEGFILRQPTINNGVLIAQAQAANSGEQAEALAQVDTGRVDVEIALTGVNN